MRKLKENRKKGFTLVELIVVLVILAILAALLVPALTGYIDKAKQKQVVAETRQCVMAVQTMIDETFAKNDTPGSIVTTDAEKLAEVQGTITAMGSSDVDKNGHLLKLEYTSKGGWKCTYTAEYTNGKLSKSEYSDPSKPVSP